MKREIEVGDVYAYCEFDSLKKRVYKISSINNSDNWTYIRLYDMSIGVSWLIIEEDIFTQKSKYLWKLKPRYKRIFSKQIRE